MIDDRGYLWYGVGFDRTVEILGAIELAARIKERFEWVRAGLFNLFATFSILGEPAPTAF